MQALTSLPTLLCVQLVRRDALIAKNQLRVQWPMQDVLVPVYSGMGLQTTWHPTPSGQSWSTAATSTPWATSRLYCVMARAAGS